jgi:hypothetical protein
MLISKTMKNIIGAAAIGLAMMGAAEEEGAHNTLIALLRRNLFLPNCLRQMEIIRTELAAVSKPTIEAA